MAKELTGKRIALLVDNGFERVELTEPRKALQDAGARTELISPQRDRVRSVEDDVPGSDFPVDVNLADADPESYDALVLPGGVGNPDKLRANAAAVAFVQHFVDQGKPIAAICHGPWTLIETGMVKGRRMTSYPSLKTDLKNAGAQWEDSEVVTDRGLVTSRKPADLPAFNRKMIEEFAEGNHGPGLSEHAEGKATRPVGAGA